MNKLDDTRIEQAQEAAAQRKSGLRWLRRLGVVLVGLVVFLLLLRAMLGAAPGRALVERIVEGRAFSGQTITLDGLDGDMFSDLRIERITVSDTDGVWLTLEDARLDWTARRLLGRAIDVETLRAGVIRFERPPIMPERSDPPSEGGEIPLKSIRIGALQAPQIDIAAMGERDPLRLALESGLLADRTSGALRLKLTNEDGDAGDFADIDLSWTDGFRIDGQAQILAPTGGVIQSLLPVPETEDIRLSFTGDGARQDWNTKGALIEGGSEIASWTSQGEGLALNGELKLNLAQSELLRAAATRLGDTASLEYGLSPSDGRTSSLTLDLRSDNLSARLFGPVILDDRELAAPLTILARSDNLSGLVGLDDLSAKDFVLKGNLNPQKQGVEFIGDVSTGAFAFSDQVTLSKSAARIAATIRGSDLDLTLDLDLDKPRFSVAQLNALIGDRLTAITAVDVDLETLAARIERASLRGASVSANAKGEFKTDAPYALTGELSVLDLSRLSSAVAGRANASWRLKQDKDMVLTLNGATRDMKTLDPFLTDLLGDRVMLNAAATLKANGGLSSRLSANAGGVTVKGQADLNKAGALDAAVYADVDAITHPAAVVTGAQLEVTAKGPLDALALTAASTLDAVNAGGVESRDLRLSLNGLYDGANLTGQGALDGVVNDKPLASQTRFSLGETIGLNDLRAQWAGLTLTGEMLQAPAAAPSARLQLTGSPDLPGASGHIDLNAALQDNQASVDGVLSDVAYKILSLSDAEFTLAGDLSALSFSAQGKGEVETGDTPRPFNLSAAGDATLSDTARQASIELFGAFDGEPVATVKPVSLNMTEQALTLGGALEVLGGQLQLNAERMTADNALLAEVALQGVDIARIGALAGREGVTGQADLTLNWRGQADQGAGDMALELSDLKRVMDGSPVMGLSLTARSYGDQWLAELDASGEQGLSLTGQARTPLRVRNGLPQHDPNLDAVNFDLQGEGELGPLWTLIGIETVELDGKFQLTAQGNAPLTTMRPQGRLEFREGGFEHAKVGVRLKDISVDALFDTNAIYLERASAVGVDGGAIRGRGDMYFDPTKPSNLFLDLDGLQVVERRGQELQLTGRAILEKAEKGARVTGELIADHGLLDITSLTSNQSIQTVEVTFPDADAADEEEIPPERQFPVVIDLKLKAPNQVYIRGAGLDVEMSTDVGLRGRLSNLVLVGDSQVVRGGFELAGQRFDFDEGRVVFNGKPKFARLNFTASRSSDGVTSYLGIQGTPAHPEIVLSSTPALPEDEVLARLLFGRSAAELSSLEAAQLAAGIASMSNGNGLNPLSEVRNAVGLDRLTLSSDDQGDARVGAGKYLAKDVYLEFRTSPNEVADVAVEWTPRENIEIGTEFQQDGDARVTVQWKKDFDD